METKVLTRIPFAVQARQCMDALHLDEDFEDEFLPIYESCLRVANPKMVYGQADVRLEGERKVYVGEMEFESRVLSINLKDVPTVYPFVATCGRELYEIALSKTDPLERYWVDGISEMVLKSAMTSAGATIGKTVGYDNLYSMNPGSLPDWPTRQQRPLFELLGDVMGTIGVSLTDSCLMLPVKSVSGLMFPSKTHYVNCSLCPREGCEGRRAPFDAALFSEKYGL